MEGPAARKAACGNAAISIAVAEAAGIVTASIAAIVRLVVEVAGKEAVTLELGNDSAAMVAAAASAIVSPQSYIESAARLDASGSGSDRPNMRWDDADVRGSEAWLGKMADELTAG